ncbi:EAL domain-containing protein [Pseudomonas stutzeri]|uniref:Diguanylate phosphodiesterase n=1 Tax=Stutzerimonas stutzeri KOS6 TaxID=1218352 RepID=A0A061JPP4_STUST|nr:EAL domain-containing protein [Stutzerimonas stutzeri]EWC40598.1 diguanylate phosphodiesterase [Stutzerimonas stutzeri KOS6]MBK3868513.1 EAL domain-containing protein [Stutzerimonas stutzeri]
MNSSKTSSNPAPGAYACHDASEHGACPSCASGERLGFGFSYAFQPIVDLQARQIFAHEALVRGPAGEPAPTVLSQVTEDNRFRFDQACRVKAIRQAARLAMPGRLSINFMPNAIYRPELCIRSTLEAARAHDFPVDRIIFETVEGERVNDAKWLATVLREYQRIGFLTAIDDFGAGFAGLNLLADFQPDIIKLDMDLIRGIDQSRARQAIVRAAVGMCAELDIQVIAEGIETADECSALRDLGIHLMQGFLFSRPLFEACAQPESLGWPQ